MQKKNGTIFLKKDILYSHQEILLNIFVFELTDVIEDLERIRQGKSFAGTSEIYYDYAEYNPV